MAEISIVVNGNRHRVQVNPHELLADILRTKLGYVEVKNGCGNGECGSCTVLLEGKAVASCITLALKADGKKIITAAGLAENGQLHTLQRKFIEHEAIQCGYCTPGMLISAKALLDSNPNPTEEQVRLAISGNICRCTGYQQIVEAIMAAAQELQLQHVEPGAKSE
jgi:carbon-monoxide dehydrogenase small subunit